MSVIKISEEFKNWWGSTTSEERKYFFSLESLKGIEDEEERREEWAKRFLIFSKWYWGQDVRFGFADFHLAWAKNIYDHMILKKGFLFTTELSARELAKTSAIAKPYIAYLIAYKVDFGLIWVGSSVGKNKSDMRSLKAMILSNKEFINDFGDFTPKVGDQNTSLRVLFGNENEKERFFISFITPNTIERGITHPYTRAKIRRVITDDFETEKSLASPADTQRNWTLFTQDLLQSMGQEFRSVVNFSNYLSKLGNTERLKKMAHSVSVVPLYEENTKGEKKILWRDKYCWTKKEAEKTGKISIDEIQEQCSRLETEGRGYNIFRKEYLCQQIGEDELYHDLKSIRKHSNFIEPIEVYQGINIYKEYDPATIYYAGFDTSSGVGRDANAFFIMGRKPGGAAEEVAILSDNNIKQIDMADLFYKFALERYGLKIYLTLDDNFGLSFKERLVDSLKYPKDYLYRRNIEAEQGVENTGGSKTTRYGFRATAGNKELVASAFAKAIQEGDVVLHSDLMYKMITEYTNDAHINNKRMARDLDIALVGGHYDALDAARLCLFGEANRVIQVKKEMKIKRTENSTEDFFNNNS